jgi:hypothetical protein
MDGEPPFISTAAKYREGTCPQSFWQSLPVQKEDQDKKIMLRGADLGETLAVHWNSKALVDGINRDWIGKVSFPEND